MEVSVIVPVYNSEKYLCKCMDSLIGQTLAHDAYEIIVVNDGSTDESEKIMASYCERYPIVHLVSKINGGVASARNEGLDNAKGEYIAFVDSDDYVDSRYLEKLLAIYNTQKTDLAICNISVEGKALARENEGKYSQIETLRRLYTRGSFMGYLVNKLFRASIIAENKLRFDVNCHFCEDSLFCAEYSTHISSSYYDSSALYHYCLHGESVTQSKYSEKRFSVLTAYEKIQNCLEGYKDEELNERLNVNYFIHCITLYRMLYKNDVRNTEKTLTIKKQIRLRWLCFFSKYMPLRERLRAVCCLVKK